MGPVGQLGFIFLLHLSQPPPTESRLQAATGDERAIGERRKRQERGWHDGGAHRGLEATLGTPSSPTLPREGHGGGHRLLGEGCAYEDRSLRRRSKAVDGGVGGSAPSSASLPGGGCVELHSRFGQIPIKKINKSVRSGALGDSEGDPVSLISPRWSMQSSSLPPLLFCSLPFNHLSGSGSSSRGGEEHKASAVDKEVMLKPHDAWELVVKEELAPSLKLALELRDTTIVALLVWEEEG